MPSYYRNHGGFLIAAAIDKYVFVAVTRPFRDGIFLKYSSQEEVTQVADVRHPLIREALTLLDLDAPKVGIASLTDIPAGGTGLGSSGSFTTALLKALHTHYRRPLPQNRTAELACHIEIDRLGEPVGKQDQYIAAYGGLTCFTFHPDETVTVEPLAI
ncbi:MAG: galactokinase, partial [Planctomycetota bacterium]|nr:galactokinase [Planctomycetota bacterium]